jgi:hypothetical protein
LQVTASGYCLLFAIKYLKLKDKTDLKLFRDISIFGLLSFIATILPPLDIKVYQLLIKFYQHKELISSFIDEWYPLTSDPVLTALYGSIYLLTLGSFLWICLKNKKQTNFWIFLPLLPVALFTLSSVRHTAFSLPALAVFFTPLISKIHLKTPKYTSDLLVIVLIIIVGFTLNAFGDLNKETYGKAERFYPDGPINFIRHNLEGNMLNDMGMGGYMLHGLGPEKKVFIDGRTEMYLPEVLKDFQGFSLHKYDAEPDLLNYFNYIVKKYNISYIYIPSDNFTVWRKMMHILYSEATWHLVFFDDSGLVFARDDGKNDQVIKEYGMKAITPFQKNIYKEGMEEEAFEEFKKIDQLTPSSVSKNSVGFFLYKQKNFSEAKSYFIKAIERDPFSSSPKVNLAEIYVTEGKLNEAIDLYEQIIKEDKERSSAYLRLGQLYLQTGRPKEEAIAVWQLGVNNLTIDQVQEEINKVGFSPGL